MARAQRRRFLIAASALLAAGRTLAQQPGRQYRVGVLLGGGQEGMRRYTAALSGQLARLGFIQNQNLLIDVSPTGAFTGSFQQEEALSAVRELLERGPDALFTCLTLATRAAQKATQTVPVVFAWVSDPMAAGLVRSYSHPGGNITGVSNRFGELLIKRLELARELVPGIKRIAVIGYGTLGGPMGYEIFVRPLRSAASRAGIELLEFVERPWVELVEQAAHEGAGAVIPVTVFAAEGDRLGGELVIGKARERRLPVIFAGAEMVEAGGLISYGTNLVDGIRRGADLLARVLQGTKPTDIPVDQTARFEMVLNLSAVKAIGLKIPASIMVRADRIID
jgi:putative ABC transport system substrate-binding protein